jgi:hypothetical protein
MTHQLARISRRAIAGVVLAFLASGLVGCIAIFDTDDLLLSLDVSNTTVRPDAPSTLTVTAKNTGDERIVWGQGSSSCQFGAFVAVGTDVFPIDIRACTDDLAPQGLDAGETRTETWTWNGEIVVEGNLDTLPTGDHRIWATAGAAARSNLKTISIEPAVSAAAGRP